MKLRYYLEASPINGFMGTYRSIAGRYYAYPEYTIGDSDTPDFQDLINASPRKFIIGGYMQRAAYYLPFRNMLRQWLDTPVLAVNPGPQDLVLPIRLGDFVNLGRVIDHEYYDRLLSSKCYESVWITTDDWSHPYLKFFNKYRPRLFREHPLRQFQFIRQAKHIGLCCSTFSWWAAFLSSAEKIYFPTLKTAAHFWGHNASDQIDLRINSDECVLVRDVGLAKL